jgi:hypothetical protein
MRPSTPTAARSAAGQPTRTMCASATASFFSLSQEAGAAKSTKTRFEPRSPATTTRRKAAASPRSATSMRGTTRSTCRPGRSSTSRPRRVCGSGEPSRTAVGGRIFRPCNLGCGRRSERRLRKPPRAIALPSPARKCISVCRLTACGGSFACRRDCPTLGRCSSKGGTARGRFSVGDRHARALAMCSETLREPGRPTLA